MLSNPAVFTRRRSRLSLLTKTSPPDRAVLLNILGRLPQSGIRALSEQRVIRAEART
jgi:hypothetical protein